MGTVIFGAICIVLCLIFFSEKETGCAKCGKIGTGEIIATRENGDNELMSSSTNGFITSKIKCQNCGYIWYSYHPQSNS
jgi:predicted nucleic-acid-binding Zn-ribbon protein